MHCLLTSVDIYLSYEAIRTVAENSTGNVVILHNDSQNESICASVLSFFVLYPICSILSITFQGIINDQFFHDCSSTAQICLHLIANFPNQQSCNFNAHKIKPSSSFQLLPHAACTYPPMSVRYEASRHIPSRYREYLCAADIQQRMRYFVIIDYFVSTPFVFCFLLSIMMIPTSKIASTINATAGVFIKPAIR